MESLTWDEMGYRDGLASYRRTLENPTHHNPEYVAGWRRGVKARDAREYYASVVIRFPEGGALLDHGARTADELSADIIREAIAAGWDSPEATSVLEAYDSEDRPSYFKWSLDFDRSEALYELSDEAESYLNDSIAPEGYVFMNDGEMGAFVISPIDDEE